jgi:hypothetical protein
MRFYGEGKVCYPYSGRVVWDFKDGPFGTLNPVLIAHCIKLGFSTVAPVETKLPVAETKPVFPKEERPKETKTKATV